ncbi:hypothetical protein acsn021_35540 [Anaerocolumna cellulosilytica]|uniref:Uncharacterized protein n=1 Tax=Anaerocolumna cellulosilytica TaxID=433286 RepID=A0A6S6RA48_9FIRM|nr:N-acetyltransferase [Anaerocolumna cellulosilytica]MBB5195452.1 ribosomal protein S18 acetylase RimI-like enzyme [Anaerocolumna cellulosilytica]BCJ95985.1 hypothetical protein acsn021_35540 [Anaerocolumna cellulosilytica]
MDVRKVISEDITILAEFAASINKEKEHRIAYLGTDYNSVLEYFIEMQEDEQSNIFVLSEGGKLIGVVGADCCLDNNSIEMVGPFIDKNFTQDQESDVKACMKALVETVITEYPYFRYCFFLGSSNRLAEECLRDMGAEYRGSDYVMELLSEDFRPSLNGKPIFYEDSYKEAIIKLHDSVFPGTYYNGCTLIQMSEEEEYRILLEVKDDKTVGYIFYNVADPYIEFLGVDKDYRNQGIASSLLSRAIAEMLHDNAAEDLTLCVSADNKSAITLYQKVGFKINEENHSYLL